MSGVRPDDPGVGARLLKAFPGGLFKGKVTRLVLPEEDDDDQQVYYHVEYSDGDMEDLTEAELRPLLQAAAQSVMRDIVAVVIDRSPPPPASPLDACSHVHPMLFQQHPALAQAVGTAVPPPWAEAHLPRA